MSVIIKFKIFFLLLKLINQIQSIKTEEKQRPFTLLIIYSFSSNEAFNYQLSITSFILCFLSFTATNFCHKKGEQPCFASLSFFFYHIIPLPLILENGVLLLLLHELSMIFCTRNHYGLWTNSLYFSFSFCLLKFRKDIY